VCMETRSLIDSLEKNKARSGITVRWRTNFAKQETALLSKSTTGQSPSWNPWLASAGREEKTKDQLLPAVGRETRNALQFACQ
jgi:hypothetical protein